jgi:hypothetical protein
MRILPIVACATLLVSLGNCDKKWSDSDDATNQDTSVARDGSASPESNEVLRSPRSEECLNIHYPGDWEQPGDTCWDPPEHYCADGQSEAVVKACAPDMSVCCIFGGSCIPCGWVSCSYCGDGLSEPETACGEGEQHQGGDELPECVDAPLSLLDDPNCPVIDWGEPICRDGVAAQLGCEETAINFSIAATQQLDGLVSCSGNEECVLVAPELECLDVDVHLVECPMAVNAQSSGAFEAGILALTETFCAAGVHPCQATPGCPSGEAECVDGACQFVLAQP